MTIYNAETLNTFFDSIPGNEEERGLELYEFYRSFIKIIAEQISAKAVIASETASYTSLLQHSSIALALEEKFSVSNELDQIHIQQSYQNLQRLTQTVLIYLMMKAPIYFADIMTSFISFHSHLLFTKHSNKDNDHVALFKIYEGLHLKPETPNFSFGFYNLKFYTSNIKKTALETWLVLADFLFLLRSYQLKELDFSGFNLGKNLNEPENNMAWRYFCQGLAQHNLTKLSLKNNSFYLLKQEHWQLLDEALSPLKDTLEELDISYNFPLTIRTFPEDSSHPVYFTNENFQLACKILGEFSNLRKLNLSQNFTVINKAALDRSFLPPLTLTQVKILLNTFVKLTNLRELNLATTFNFNSLPSNHKIWAAFCKIFPVLPQLKILDLSGNAIGIMTLKQIKILSEHLASLTQLEELNLNNNMLCYLGENISAWSCFWSIFVNLSSLNTLHLSGNVFSGIEEAAWQTFLRSLVDTSISYIIIAKLPIWRWTPLLQALPHLRKLDLTTIEWADMYIEAKQDFLQALAHAHITEINLSTNIAFRDWALLLENLPRLQTLNLKDINWDTVQQEDWNLCLAALSQTTATKIEVTDLSAERKQQLALLTNRAMQNQSKFTLWTDPTYDSGLLSRERNKDQNIFFIEASIFKPTNKIKDKNLPGYSNSTPKP